MNQIVSLLNVIVHSTRKNITKHFSIKSILFQSSGYWFSQTIILTSEIHILLRTFID